VRRMGRGEPRLAGGLGRRAGTDAKAGRHAGVARGAQARATSRRGGTLA
jgi:hypothetical protein